MAQHLQVSAKHPLADAHPGADAFEIEVFRAERHATNQSLAIGGNADERDFKQLPARGEEIQTFVPSHAIPLRIDHLREDELRASLRCDQHFRLAMRNFEQPCEWNHDQCWKVLTAIMVDDDTPSQKRANVKQVIS